jgi:hypothetical protein
MLKLGRQAETLAVEDWQANPLPEGLDYSFFQAAPTDQQVSEIRANERLVLENLHPDHEKLVTSLPGIRPAAVVERATGEREQVALVADTLWIDTDRGICAVVWRGRIGLRHAQEAGRIAVSLERGAREISARDRSELDVEAEAELTITPEPEEGETANLAVMTMLPELAALGGADPVMPFLGGSGKASAPGSGAGTARPKDDALPFGRGAGAPGAIPGPKPPLSVPLDGTFSVPLNMPGAGGAPPEVPPAAPPVTSLPAEPVLLAPSPPPMVMQPPRIAPIAPSVSVSPWASGAAESAPSPVAPPPFIPPAPVEAPKLSPAAVAPSPGRAELEAPPVADEAAAKRGWKPVGLRAGDGSKGPPLSPNSALGGAVAASDAAAAASARRDGGERAPAKGFAAPLAMPPKVVIELLWLDPAAMPRIRRQPGWKEIIGQLKGKAFEDELAGDSPPERRQEIKDRRDVAGLLARGDAVDMAGIDAALASAVTEDGTFVPPLVLVAGELEFPFDEVETLKATMAALTPLASGDKKLKETLDTTEELLKTPWLKGASNIAEGLTAKLKEVFAQGNRMLPPRYLESHTERMLLEQRAYQKRTVLGKVCIRSLLQVPGAQGGIPVYLPESLGRELPSFQRFATRIIGEARGRLDQYETQEYAVRAVSLGKLLRRP